VKHCIIVGCDVHVKEMLLKVGVDQEKPHQRKFRNTRRGRQQMLAMLKGLSEEWDGAGVVFVYESSSLGYVLYDEVTAAGFECYVLATSKLARTWKHLAYKTDARDAHLLFQQARNFVLAGDPLPSVVVPEPQVRDDREVTRARSDAAGKLTRVKNQVQSLLKRYGLERADDTGAGSWSAGRWAGVLGSTCARCCGSCGRWRRRSRTWMSRWRRSRSSRATRRAWKR
jgi:transposase